MDVFDWWKQLSDRSLLVLLIRVQHRRAMGVVEVRALSRNYFEDFVVEFENFYKRSGLRDT